MPRWCETKQMPDGSVMLITHSGATKPTKCDYCDRPHIALCDWRVDDRGNTCDKKLCKIHAMKPIPTFGKVEDIDYCPEHYRMYKQSMLEIKK